MIYSRLHYFGAYYSEYFDGKEIMSCYEWEITEHILKERQKPENAQYDYPDFEAIGSQKMRENPQALEEWIQYIKFNLNIDWEMAQKLIVQIPTMVSSGVVGRDEIVAIYKENIRKAGSRATKKAEKLIDNLCMSMPLATRKGNITVTVEE